MQIPFDSDPSTELHDNREIKEDHPSEMVPEMPSVDASAPTISTSSTEVLLSREVVSTANNDLR